MPQVEVGDDTLTQTLSATNIGHDPFELTAALHTYYGISAIGKVESPFNLLGSFHRFYLGIAVGA